MIFASIRGAAELKLSYLSKTEIGDCVHRREFALTDKAGTGVVLFFGFFGFLDFGYARERETPGNKRTVTQYHFYTWTDNSGLSPSPPPPENLEEIKKLVDIPSNVFI